MLCSRSNRLLALLALRAAVSGSTAFVVVSSLGATTPASSSAFAPPERTVSKARTPMPSPSQQQSSRHSSALSMAGPELVDPSYNLAIGAFGIGLAAGFGEDLRDGDGEKLLTAKPLGALAVLFTVFSLFLAFQTTTLRFGFDDDSFSLVSAGGARLERDNVVVGGENRWRYASFLNYDFLPSRGFPVLVYFREDQTPVETREEVPIAIDALEGQVHFFPAISNTKQLEEGFIKHNCQHL